jgi:hypothetical protein
VKGEALAPPAGRADDFIWPRREVGREQAKGETPVATTAPNGTVSVVGPDGTVSTSPAAPPKPPQKRVFRPAQTAPSNQLQDFFGFGSTAPPRQSAPPPRAPGVPRPPTNVGRSAEAPGPFTR